MTSNVPVVNGSERMARHCTNCGRDEGHSYRECPNTRLSEDESNTLYNMIAGRHNQRFFGTEYPDARSVQFNFQQAQDYEAERTYGSLRPASSYPQGAINEEEDYADWPTLRLGSLSGGQQDRWTSGSRTIDCHSLIPEPNLAMVGTLALFEGAEKSKPAQEVEQVTHLELGESYGLTSGSFRTCEDTDVFMAIAELQILEGHTSETHSVVAPKNSQSLSIEDIFEQAALDAQAIEAARKRRRVDIEDILNEDENHQFEPRRPMKRGPQAGRKTPWMEKTIGALGESSADATKVPDKGKKKIRQLNEINGREGLGPIDYKNMLAQIRVNISILDLMQISPDAAKAFKHYYSTRRNGKRGRKPSQLDTAAVNLLSSSSQHTVPRGIQQRDRPFRFLEATIICPKMKSKLVLDTAVTQADQGSDINLISDL
ncbi:hypothetical protein K3495_g13640, partial [Podosphaera aphanis]